MQFNDRLIQLMDSRGVTAYRMHKDMGISQQVVSDWKAGKRIPSGVNLDRLAVYFNVSVDYLLCKTDDPAPAVGTGATDDVQIEILARAARKMTTEEKQKLIDMAKVMFEKAFDETGK